MKTICLLLAALLCLLSACTDDDGSTWVEPEPAPLVQPLDDGQIGFVMSGDLPVPTYRNDDATTLSELDGTWRFQTDPDEIGLDRGWQRAAWWRGDWREIEVPGVWNAAFDDLFEYRGVGWYAKTFEVDEPPANALIRFGAVFLQCEVYLNGVLVGTHSGGYTPIHVPVGSALKAGENVLVVRADNRITDGTIPVATYFNEGHGWWPYGGISRSVTLHALPDPWLFKIEPAFDGDAVALTLGVLAGVAGEPAVSWEIASPTGAGYEGRAQLAVPGGGIYFYRLTFPVETPAVWSRETPQNLYALFIRAEGGDGAAVRFGHRTIEVIGGDLWLNGARDTWWGINRHSDYEDTGSVETDETIAREVALIQDLYANHVRPGHYPVAPALLDALADAGITVLEEIPQYQLLGPQTLDPVLIDNARLQLGEMIERDKNNPAVVSWSVGNEFANYLPGGGHLVEILADEARRLDRTRPITAVITQVSCIVPLDFALPTVDIIGLNQYYGWYYADVEDAAACFDTIHGLYPEKALVASEFGCGAVAGTFLDGEPAPEPTHDHSYTEDWQAWFLGQQFGQILSRDYVDGTMPWVLADFHMEWDPSTGDPHPVSRTNLKGLVTQDRQTRKMAFDLVADTYAWGRWGRDAE